MIYLVSKRQQFLQCERPSWPASHVLIVIEPGGPGGEEETERYTCAVELQRRWGAVHRQLEDDGWSGPFGRATAGI